MNVPGSNAINASVGAMHSAIPFRICLFMMKATLNEHPTIVLFAGTCTGHM